MATENVTCPNGHSQSFDRPDDFDGGPIRWECAECGEASVQHVDGPRFDGFGNEKAPTEATVAADAVRVSSSERAQSGEKRTG